MLQWIRLCQRVFEVNGGVLENAVWEEGLRVSKDAIGLI